MHFLLFEVRPKPTHKDYARLGGAMVTVVVDDRRELASEPLARTLIERQEWVVTVLKESRHLDSAPLGRDDLSEAFQWTRRDGVAAIFQTWPRRAV